MIVLLLSQFADLDEPADAIAVGAAQTAEQMVTEIRKWLALL